MEPPPVQQARRQAGKKGQLQQQPEGQQQQVKWRSPRAPAPHSVWREREKIGLGQAASPRPICRVDAQIEAGRRAVFFLLRTALHALHASDRFRSESIKRSPCTVIECSRAPARSSPRANRRARRVPGPGRKKQEGIDFLLVPRCIVPTARVAIDSLLCAQVEIHYYWRVVMRRSIEAALVGPRSIQTAISFFLFLVVCPQREVWCCWSLSGSWLLHLTLGACALGRSAVHSPPTPEHRQTDRSLHPHRALTHATPYHTKHRPSQQLQATTKHHGLRRQDRRPHWRPRRVPRLGHPPLRLVLRQVSCY